MRTLNILGCNVVLDDEDYEAVKAANWKVRAGNGHQYVVKSQRIDGKRVLRILHRELMKAPRDKWVDHKNGNTLDNRKENLRLCTPAENNRNRRQEAGAVSRFKGVSRHSATRWKAQIQVNGRHMYLGVFASEEKAAEVYNEAAARFFGEFYVGASR